MPNRRSECPIETGVDNVTVRKGMHFFHRFQRSLLFVFALVMLTACVNQHPGKSDATSRETGNTAEQSAVESAAQKIEALGRPPRVIATSPSASVICDRLEMDLVGVCKSTISKIPERYDSVERIGMPMSPDMEKVGALHPDFILSPDSLISDLRPKYEAIGANYAFLNLRSVRGMYESIRELGIIFDRKDQADRLIDEFETFYTAYQEKNAGKKKPRVLILMGLPGSYIIATEHSYIGSLVEMAGGENVYAGSNQEFLNVNTEDMKTKEPDIILRAAHALPDNVIRMFEEEFEKNPIWKHFAAVQEGKVYDLTYELFGMSATFRYPEALAELQPIFYPASPEEEEAAKKKSRDAQKKAEEFSTEERPAGY